MPPTTKQTFALIPSYSALFATSSSTSNFSVFLKPVIQRLEGIWTIPKISLQGRWEKWGFWWVHIHQRAAGPLGRQVKNHCLGVDHLKIRPPLKIKFPKPSSLLLSRSILASDVHSFLQKWCPHITAVSGQRRKMTLCATYLFICLVWALLFWTLIVFTKALLWNNWLLKDSVLCEYTHLIQLPVGLKWEQNWILMQQTGLKSSFPF